ASSSPRTRRPARARSCSRPRTTRTHGPWPTPRGDSASPCAAWTWPRCPRPSGCRRADGEPMTRFGVLALQGDFAAHEAALRSAGVASADVRAVRRVADLADLRGLVLPGGESTTLLKLMAEEDWFAALREFHARGGALLGTCAGAILLAREVNGPRQPSLGLVDATIDRNAYG